MYGQCVYDRSNFDSCSWSRYSSLKICNKKTKNKKKKKKICTIYPVFTNVDPVLCVLDLHMKYTVEMVPLHRYWRILCDLLSCDNSTMCKKCLLYLCAPLCSCWRFRLPLDYELSLLAREIYFFPWPLLNYRFTKWKQNDHYYLITHSGMELFHFWFMNWNFFKRRVRWLLEKNTNSKEYGTSGALIVILLCNVKYGGGGLNTLHTCNTHSHPPQKKEFN